MRKREREREREREERKKRREILTNICLEYTLMDSLPEPVGHSSGLLYTIDNVIRHPV